MADLIRGSMATGCGKKGHGVGVLSEPRKNTGGVLENHSTVAVRVVWFGLVAHSIRCDAKNGLMRSLGKLCWLKLC